MSGTTAKKTAAKKTAASSDEALQKDGAQQLADAGTPVTDPEGAKAAEEAAAVREEEQRDLPATPAPIDGHTADTAAALAETDQRFHNAGTGEVNEVSTTSGKITAYTGDGDVVTIDEDVVETFYYPDTKRPSTRLLYVKGQQVQRSVIDAYNAAVKS